MRGKDSGEEERMNWQGRRKAYCAKRGLMFQLRSSFFVCVSNCTLTKGAVNESYSNQRDFTSDNVKKRKVSLSQ